MPRQPGCVYLNSLRQRIEKRPPLLKVALRNTHTPNYYICRAGKREIQTFFPDKIFTRLDLQRPPLPLPYFSLASGESRAAETINKEEVEGAPPTSNPPPPPPPPIVVASSSASTSSRFFLSRVFCVFRPFPHRYSQARSRKENCVETLAPTEKRLGKKGGEGQICSLRL